MECLPSGQHKGRNRSPLTLDLPVLPVLQAIMDASPTGDLSFLVTEQSKPFTAAGFTKLVSRTLQRGRPASGLSAHGLRKAGATRAAENGATAHQLMAIFGWRTIKQAEGLHARRRTQAARERRNASARNKKCRNVSHLEEARARRWERKSEKR